MSGTTPIYGLTYAGPADPADGAGNEQTFLTQADTAIAGLSSIMTAPQSFANNSLVNVTTNGTLAFQLAYLANSAYRIRLYLIYQALAAAGTKIAWVTSTAVTSFRWTANGLAASVTAATSGVILRASQVAADTVAIGAAGLGTDVTAEPYGWLVTGANPGTLTLQAAQVTTTGGSPTVIQAGSRLWARKSA